MVVEFDDQNKRVHLVPRAAQILAQLKENAIEHADVCTGVIWHPEFARYMLEATPLHPYEHGIPDLLTVECNMKQRCETFSYTWFIFWIGVSKLQRFWPPIKNCFPYPVSRVLDLSILFLLIKHILIR